MADRRAVYSLQQFYEEKSPWIPRGIYCCQITVKIIGSKSFWSDVLHRKMKIYSNFAAPYYSDLERVERVLGNCPTAGRGASYVGQYWSTLVTKGARPSSTFCYVSNSAQIKHCRPIQIRCYLSNKIWALLIQCIRCWIIDTVSEPCCPRSCQIMGAAQKLVR